MSNILIFSTITITRPAKGSEIEGYKKLSNQNQQRILRKILNGEK